MLAPSRFKRSVVLFIPALLFLCQSASALDIVKDGRPRATIVVADDAGRWQKWAAGWLQGYVRKSTGAVLTIVSESESPSGNLISVGRTRLSEKAGIRTDGLKWDGCRLVVKGGTLYLIGRDTEPLKTCTSPLHLRDAGAQGTAKAVATFLEDHVGIRWFIPSPEGTVIPSLRDITVPDDLDKTFVPAIAYTSLSSRYEPAGAVANNERIAMKRRGYGGHSWYVQVSEKGYFETHPEYFRMNESGERVGARGHLCTSNPEVWHIIRDKIRAEFDKGYDVVQLGQSDGWRPCLCPNCMKMDNHRSAATITRDNPCNKVWDMHKWVIDECRKRHPDKKVMVMIYGPTGWPSKKWDRLPDNVIGEIAPLTPERLDAWAGKVPAITNWTYWWHASTMNSVFVPAVSPEFLQRKLREFRELKVVGITGAPQFNWGLGGPAYYCFYKLCGDPDADVDRLVREYCNGVYGAAGRTMKRFFDLFHARSGMTIPLKEKARIHDSYYAEDAFSLLYPPKVIQRMERLLSKAEKRPDTPHAKGWLRHTRECFEGLKAVSFMFVHKRAFEAAPTRDNLLAVRAAVDAFEEWREEILLHDRSEASTWFPDHHRLAAALLSEGKNSLYNEFHYSAAKTYAAVEDIRAGKRRIRGLGFGSTLGGRQVRGPVTWDFGDMPANLGKPKQEKRVVIPRADRPPKIDGSIDDKEWEGAPALGFETYRAPGSKVKDNAVTTVRLLYDERALYVSYECVEPNTEGLKLRSVGRDGNVYGNDEVELFLNPDLDSTTKFMQFMTSPVRGAFYDARVGYITDVLDPNYGKRETTTWNPEWRYGFRIDSASGKWTLEMAVPFAEIGEAAPKPGTTWTGNFARVRRAAGEDLSCWVAESFNNPEHFGELVFGPVPQNTRPTAGTPKAPLDRGPDQYIVNSGFEMGAPGEATGWRIDSYPERSVRALLDHTIPTLDKAHTGRRSLKLDFSTIRKEGLGRASQITFGQGLDAKTVQALRGHEAVLSAWVCYELKPEDVKGSYIPGPYLMIRCWGPNGLIRAGRKAPGMTLDHNYLADKGYASQAADRWMRVSSKGYIPPGTERMDLHCGLVAIERKSKKTNTVLVYIDDVQLEPVDRKE